jgi:hypothetical protein
MNEWLKTIDSALGLASPHQFGGSNAAQKGGTPQATDLNHESRVRSPVPPVPMGLEGARKDEHENTSLLSFVEPVGGGVGEASAPEKIGFIPSCSCCGHLMRPGLSDGLCGGDREDLPYAFTPGHPLRRLPLNGGTDCPKWVIHWSYPRVLPGGALQGTESPVFCVGNGAES